MRYLLFAGVNCSPKGGFDDFNGSVESIEDGIMFIEMSKDDIEWAHIVDNMTYEIVKYGIASKWDLSTNPIKITWEWTDEEN